MASKIPTLGVKLPSTGPSSRKKAQSRVDSALDVVLYAVVTRAESGNRIPSFLVDFLVKNASRDLKVRLAAVLVNRALNSLIDRVKLLPAESGGYWWAGGPLNSLPAGS